MFGFINGIAFKIVAGLLITAGVGGYILILQANLQASKANEGKAVAAVVTAQNNTTAMAARLAEEQRVASQLRAAERQASAAHRLSLNAAKAKTITLTKTITIERQKDANFNTCLGVVWPDSVVRHLPQ